MSKFKIGDKVKLIGKDSFIGTIQTMQKPIGSQNCHLVKFDVNHDGLQSMELWMNENEIEKVES